MATQPYGEVTLTAHDPMNGLRNLWEEYQQYRRSREPRRLWERIAEWNAAFEIVFIVGMFLWAFVSALFHR